MFTKFFSDTSIKTVIICFLVSLLFSKTVSQSSSPLKLIHFGDVIEVKVLGFPEYDWTGKINPEGYLDDLEFVEEPIYALCEDEQTVARRIKQAYAKYIRDPKVRVRIVDTSERPTAVLVGAIRNPARFRIKRDVRLSEVIALAGGLTENSSGEIVILRSTFSSCERQSEAYVQIKVQVKDLLAGKEEANPFILSGDVVEATEAEPIYVIGAVARSGKLSFRPEMRLTQAIASAGGLTKQADGKILIFRKISGGREKIEINFDDIKAKKKEDLVLRAHDIIEVQEKGKPKDRSVPIVPEEEKKDFSQLPIKTID